MRCERRWCWRKYVRVTFDIIHAGSGVIRVGRWYCHKHADEADARLAEARKTLGRGQWV